MASRQVESPRFVLLRQFEHFAVLFDGAPPPAGQRIE